MSQHEKADKQPVKSTAPDRSSDGASGAQKLQRSLAGCSYQEQVQMLKPPMPFGVGPVQAKGGAEGTSEETGEGVHETAAEGVQGPSQALPHLGKIQSSFGQHDVSGVKAHVGGAAADANRALGAQAYATGSSVAFKNSPDLHTAAHEAAHIVQQRAGVSLAGGVGSVGDSYERNADAVADRVVSGRTAADLLPGGDGAGGGLQLLALQLRGDEDVAGDTQIAEDFLQMACDQKGVSKAEVLAWVQSKRPDATFVSVADAVDLLHGLTTRDDYFNSAIKVQFENQLGQALNADRPACDPVLNEVLQWCLSYLTTKTRGDETALKAEWDKMVKMHGGAKDDEKQLFYGRISDAISESINGQTYHKTMKDLFSGGGGFSVSQKCLAIQEFHNKIYEKDFGRGEQPSAQLLALMQELNVRAMNPNEVRWGLSSTAGGSTATDIFGSDSTGGRVEGEDGGRRRGRGVSQPGVHGRERTDTRGVGARESGSNALDTNVAPTGDQDQVHGRGIDLWTMDERQPFIQQARVLDMPLAGSVSGTTSDLIAIAMMAGVQDEMKKFKFVCAAMDHFIGAGAHTFHEITTAAQPLGITFTPGDYYSFFEKFMTEMPSVKAIFDEARSGQGPFKLVKGVGKPL